jgi:hypothetical protein
VESYTPKELDIPFPEITSINIGVCPGYKTHYMEVTPWSAHTHQCKRDRYYKSICVYDKKHLFNSDGSISDILWHEYAHVLDANYFGPLVVNCDVRGMHEIEFPTSDERANWESTGHGASWESIMIKFGKPASLTVSLPR